MGDHAPYVTFMVAVAVTGWLAGFGPAVLTVAISIPAALVFVIPGSEPGLAKLIGVSIYGAGMLAIAFLGRSVRAAWAKALAAKDFQRAILDVLPAKVAVLDRDGKVIAVNERWPDLVPGTDYLQFCRQCAQGGDASAVGAYSCLEAVLSGQKDQCQMEYPCDSAGDRHWFMMHVMRPPKHVGGAIISHVDITQLKLTEDRLRETASELARSNGDLEQFAYLASHDLQEPLRTITAHLGLIQRRLEEKLDPRLRQSMDFVTDAAGRMQALIKDLLEYSRVSQKTEGFVPMDMEALFRTVIENLGACIREARATITHEPLPTVAAEPKQMMQLLQNLIGNALKYRQADVPPVIHVAAHREEKGWRFSVRDNGIGIDPSQWDRIFMIFQRLHTRQEYAGTGIGLAICKRVIEHHCGRIWIESILGEGSTFFFTIPDRI